MWGPGCQHATYSTARQITVSAFFASPKHPHVLHAIITKDSNLLTSPVVALLSEKNPIQSGVHFPTSPRSARLGLALPNMMERA